jgi:hypothetical protein
MKNKIAQIDERTVRHNLINRNYSGTSKKRNSPKEKC